VGLFAIHEQLGSGSAGLIAGSSTHLIPGKKRLTGIEGARSAGDLPVRFPKVIDYFPKMA
jgi:hypothetical protein